MDPRHEDLYDEYLERALTSGSEPPEEFLARHGVDDPALLDSLRAVARESAAPSAPPISTLGEYRILRKLGEGGMGVVHLAEQPSLGRQVALKVIRAEYAGSASASSRFEREARAIARLRHPGIVAIHGYGSDRGVRFIAMELVEGRGLDEIIQAERVVAPARAARWGAQLASALHYAHEHGIVHRDVKPSNIRVAPDDRAMLVDFGLARDASSHAATLTEAFVGSPLYAAPEQVGRGGGAIDARTDVYALGVVLYQCVTGHTPIPDGTLEQVLKSILDAEPPTARSVNPAVPRDLSVVIEKAMRKEPPARYANAKELERDLRAILELGPISARPPGLLDRARRWARRHRAGFAASLTAAVAVIGMIVWAAVERADEVRAHRLSIASALDEAEGGVRAYREARLAADADESQYAHLADSLLSEPLTDRELRDVDAAESRLERSRLDRDLAFQGVLEAASRAERLGADPELVQDLRGLLYVERALAAETARDAPAAEMFRGMALQHDPTGRHAQVLRGPTSVTLTLQPPDAEVHLFKIIQASSLRAGAPRRLVRVPLRGEPPDLPADRWALRVVEAAGDMLPDDLIIEVAGRPIEGVVLVADDQGEFRRLDRLVSVDGEPAWDPAAAELYSQAPANSVGPTPTRRYVIERGGQEHEIIGPPLSELGVKLASCFELASEPGVAVRVWRDGSVFEATTTGARLRPTAAPLAIGAASRVDLARDLHRLEPGAYLLFARRPGYESQRIVVFAPRGASLDLSVSLLPDGTTPPGWVYVPPETRAARAPFWIMERELSMAEYYEFVNDPATLAEIAASPTRIRYPRQTVDDPGIRDAQGRFQMPEDWEPDWPVFLVSWNDAQAYIAWRTRKDKEAGINVRYSLPDDAQWCRASGIIPGARFHFGDRFRARWVSSVFAYVAPLPRPAMSFPIDESPLGVYDMSGSISEWSLIPWRRDQIAYRFCGGSWGVGDPGQFTITGGNGAEPHLRTALVGFRLVMTREENPE